MITIREGQGPNTFYHANEKHTVALTPASNDDPALCVAPPPRRSVPLQLADRRDYTGTSQPIARGTLLPP